MLQKKVNLFGLLIDDIDMEGAIEISREALAPGEQKSFFTPNLEILDGARKSAGVCDVLNSANVSLPDGVGVKIVGRLLGKPINNTVAGIDFGENLFKLASKEGKSVFLLGGKEGVAERAANRLQAEYSNLQISGVHHGYFGEDELNTVCRKINDSKAEVLIVCRGFPRQEKFVFMAKYRLPNVKIFACLGGAIDIWSGAKKRAPAFVVKLRLEWFWRIIGESERAKRFLISLDTLFEAIKIWFKNLLYRLGMKRGDYAYNRTSKSVELRAWR